MTPRRFFVFLAGVAAISVVWFLLILWMLKSTDDEDIKLLISTLMPMAGTLVGMAGGFALWEALTR